MGSQRHASRAMLLIVAGLFSLGACTCDESDWELTVADDDQSLPGQPTFGVGLPANLSVCLQQFETHLCLAPRGLQVIADEPSKVRITVGGIVERRAVYNETLEINDTQLVQIEALEPGPNRLRFIADDTEEIEELFYEARAPVTFAGYSTVGSGESTAAEVSAFTGSYLAVRARFKAGGTELVGSCPWRLTAPAGSGTTLEYNTLQLGARAQDVTLECDGAPSPLRIHARPSTDIARIGLEPFGGNGFPSQFDGTTLTIQQGYNVFLQLEPLTAGGVPLRGWPHPPPSAEVSGGSGFVSLGSCTAVPPSIHEAPLLARGTDCLGFSAEALGEATLRLSWNSAVRTIQVRVVPRP